MTGPRWSSTSDPYITPQTGDAWATDAATRGKTGTQQLLSVDTVAVSPKVSQALSLADNERAVVRCRLILEDDQPIELADSYYPEHIAGSTALAEHRKIKGGALRLLADLGHAPAQVTEHLTARHPDEDERAKLRVPETEPLLVLTRLSWDAEGRPVEYAVMRTVAARSSGQTYQMQAPAA